MNSSNINPEEVLVTNVRCNYIYVFTPRKSQYGKFEYSVTFLVSKDDEENIHKLNSSLQYVYDKNINKFTDAGGNVLPFNSIRNPLKDGDIIHRGDEIFKHMMFIDARSGMPPGVCDANGTNITDRSALYPGVYCNIYVSFHPYNLSTVGISCELIALQKCRDGERIDIRSRMNQAARQRAISAFGSLQNNDTIF